MSYQARDYLSELYAELVDCDAAIVKYESRITAFAKNNEACKRLQEIPGVGPLTATAVVAHVGNATQFKNGRAFAASLGLTPKEYSSGASKNCLASARGETTISGVFLSRVRTSLHATPCCGPMRVSPVSCGSKTSAGDAAGLSPP